MKTSQSNERLRALCALIVEEKDPAKFLLLVHELNNLLQSTEGTVENMQLSSGHRNTKISAISHRSHRP